MTSSKRFLILAVALACASTTSGQDFGYSFAPTVSPYLNLTPDSGLSGYFSNFLPRMEESEYSRRIDSSIYRLDYDTRRLMVSNPT